MHYRIAMTALPFIPSHHRQTPENIPYTLNKNPSSTTGQLLVEKVAPTPKQLLARRLYLLVDWLYTTELIIISSQCPS